jgi:hypothetical protein
MPAARKRALQVVDSGVADPPKPPSMLQRIRNMWQFANLFQFILLFGKALKLDDNLDIEVGLAALTGCAGVSTETLTSVAVGFGSRVSQARFHGFARYRSRLSQVPLFSPRLNVRVSAPQARRRAYLE